MITTWCTSSHHKMSVSTLLLVVSLGSLIYADTSELEIRFNCTAARNAKTITDNSTSGSFLSPCYPQSYTSTYCTIHNPSCYIVLPILQEDTWIGFYNGDSNSSLSPGDYLRITNSVNRDIIIKFEDLSSDEFIHRFSYHTQPKVYFNHQNLARTDTEEHRFRLIYRIAHIIPRYQNIVSEASSEVFIVSHRNFNHGKLEENSYPASTTSGWFKLTGISTGSIVKLTFIYFKINYTRGLVWWFNWACGDYLTINGIKGYTNNNIIFCGYDEPSSIDLYPLHSEISFQFTTRGRLSSSDSRSAGFLIQYQVLQETCPQTVKHASVSRGVYGRGTQLTITCVTGYRTIANSAVQQYLCNSQEPIMPCLEVECDDLKDLRNVPYLNISLNSAGKPVAGSIITFSCNSSDYILDGDKQTTCSTNGEWDLKNMPQCIRPPIVATTKTAAAATMTTTTAAATAITTTTTTPVSTARIIKTETTEITKEIPAITNRPKITSTANGPVAGNEELDYKTTTKKPSIPLYAGIGGGSFAFLVVVVVIIVVLVKKRQISSGEQKQKRAVSAQVIYSLADECSCPSSPPPGDVYELAGPIEGEEYENTLTIQRELDKGGIAEIYADITSATKLRKPKPDSPEIELLENDLYGT